MSTSLTGTPIDILERILFFAFGCDQLSTPFSPPTPLQNTSHLLLVSKAFRFHALPFFYHSITILRARDWITFFHHRKGLFVVGKGVERKKSWVKELRINMQKDARIPIDLPKGPSDQAGHLRLMMAASSAEDRILVPLKSVVFPNLKHACFFLARLARESENDIGSEDSALRDLTMGELDINSDDEGSIISDGSFGMDEDLYRNIISSRTSFVRSLLPPFGYSRSFFGGGHAEGPRLERMSRLGLPGGSAAESRVEFAYPFPPGSMLSEPMPRVLTVYCFSSNEANDRALVYRSGAKRFEGRREDFVPTEAWLAALVMDRVPGGRVELVGYTHRALELFANRETVREEFDRVFSLRDDGSFASVASLVPVKEPKESTSDASSTAD